MVFCWLLPPPRRRNPALLLRPVLCVPIPGDEGSTHISLDGPTQVCVNSPTAFTSVGGYDCSNWAWDTDGEIISITQESGSSTVTIKWLQAGSHTIRVESSCGTNYPSAAKTISVVAPPPTQPITVLNNVGQVGTGGATICEGYSTELIPPAGSSAWAWSGDGIVERKANGNVIVRPKATTTYEVSYNSSSTPCTLNSSFYATRRAR